MWDKSSHNKICLMAVILFHKWRTCQNTVEKITRRRFPAPPEAVCQIVQPTVQSTNVFGSQWCAEKSSYCSHLTKCLFNNSYETYNLWSLLLIPFQVSLNSLCFIKCGDCPWAASYVWSTWKLTVSTLNYQMTSMLTAVGKHRQSFLLINRLLPEEFMAQSLGSSLLQYSLMFIWHIIVHIE